MHMIGRMSLFTVLSFAAGVESCSKKLQLVAKIKKKQRERERKKILGVGPRRTERTHPKVPGESPAYIWEEIESGEYKTKC